MWDELSDLVAKILTRFPGTSIILSVLVCILFAAGLHNVHLEQDIRKSFSPVDSQAALETNTFLQFHNLSIFPQRSFVVFSCIDGGDIFREQHLQEILRFDTQMTSSLIKKGDDGRRSCDPLCDLNKPFHVLLDELNKSPRDSENIIDFPITTIQSIPIFLGVHLSGAEVKVDNGSSSISATSLVLWYFSRSDTPERKEEYDRVNLHFFDLSLNKSFSDLVNFTIFADEIANHEMVRGALEATFLMSIGFVFLLIFVIIVIGKQVNAKMVPFLVLATLLTPIISALAAFGLLAWLGHPIYAMQCVTPFLVLGIGVDDAFILIHRWRAGCSVRDPASRLRRVIVDVGPSITITSVTNIVAFGVGYFTPTPQMSLFCLSNSIALLLDYILTYTLLAPVVYLCRDDGDYQVVTTVQKKDTAFVTRYSELVSSFSGRLLCFLALSSLYVFSSFGVLNMRSTFEPAKAFPSDSPLVEAIQGIRPVFDTYFPVSIYVNNPPLITDGKQYDDFMSMISVLESTNGAYQDNYTSLFIKPYEDFDKRVSSWTSTLFLSDTPYSLSYHNLPYWLEKLGNPPNVHYTIPENSTEPVVDSFSFAVFGHGMAEWAVRAQFVHTIRATLAAFPQFNATLFDTDSAVLELIMTVSTDLIGSITATVLCMAIVCLLFIQSKRGVAITIFTVTSICFNLVGCLAWWGADLDPVTQVDVLLATGFSVDYTAHIAYKFYRSSGSPAERIENSLCEMAPPMIQAGMSTFLCMMPLIFVPTYAIVAFAKTIFIVVSVGLVHGLFVLPVLLTASVGETRKVKKEYEIRMIQDDLIPNRAIDDVE